MVSELQQFLAMGGYAFYVWTSYAVALVVLVANVWWSARGLKTLRRQTRQRVLQTSSRSRRQTVTAKTVEPDVSNPSPAP